MKKVTIYHAQAFGINQIECTLNEIKTGLKIAQYTNATQIIYTRKGKRKPESIGLTYDPYCVILEGQDHVKPLSQMIDKGDHQSSRYSTFDKEIKTDFNPIINQYLKEKNITPLLDIRPADSNE